MRCQRPESCVPLMGGAGWADPLPAMRAALRECGIRLTHKRVAGDGTFRGLMMSDVMTDRYPV